MRRKVASTSYTRAVKVAILLAAMSLSAFGQRPRFAAEDLWTWRTAFDPRIRADGKSVIYVEEFFDRAANLERSNLWLASSDGRERRQWTEGAWRDWSPRWSPDGERVAWISDRSGQPQVRVRRLNSAAEVELRVDGIASALGWSADGD